MDSPSQWYFSKEDLASTPSRKNGIDSNKELSYRQQAANFIQDMGQRLQVLDRSCVSILLLCICIDFMFFTRLQKSIEITQLCINTAIVYMHRFYMYHSFMKFHRNNLSVAALFLAAKVEEQPRKLEHVIKVAHICLHKDAPPLDVRSEAYAEKQFEVVNNESVLLQTLGFMLAIDHPHTYVVKVCQLVKACKDLAQTSYFMATTSLHMTTMCLQYRPTLVACVCIHLACKWSSWKIEPCSEGKEWYYYVDRTVTLELLENLTQEFIAILETSPHKFKKKLIAQKQETSSHTPRNASEGSSKHSSTDKPVAVKKEPLTPGPSTSSFSLSQVVDKPVAAETNDKLVVPSQSMQSPQATKKNKVSSHPISLDAYREKKERERLEHKPIPPSAVESSSQPVVSRPQHASSDHDRSQKHTSNSLEPHSQSTREKAGRSSVGKPPSHHQGLSSSSKLNHHFSKKLDPVHSKESIKGDLSKLSSTVVNDPVVVLERVDVKPPREILAPEVASGSQVVTSTMTNPHEYKYSKPVENAEPIAPVAQVAEPPAVVTKSKHHKHKTNSLRPNHNSVDFHPYKRSPPKDINTNGSKEAESVEKRSVENSILNTKTPDTSSKHEKREKYKTKHSYNSSKNKVHSEPSNPAIKVKIRKEDINKLPEKSHKFEPSVKVESPQKPLKIKISKPPVVPETVKGATSLRLVITKDKSGSGSYCTSHKNERESKKRAHSPHDANSKSTEETPNKYAKLDHGHTSHSSTKQSKSRHSSSRTSNNVSSGNKLLNQGKDASGYLNVDVENYASQPYYSNQYFPYQPGYKGKTNFNPIPQPPPPPE